MPLIWGRRGYNLAQTILISDQENLQNLRELGSLQKTFLVMEFLVRNGLIIMFLVFEYLPAGVPTIQKENLWRHRFPLKDSQVPYYSLLAWIVVAAFLTIFVLGLTSNARRKGERIQATLGISLSLLLAMVITNVIKVTVGRPRPNYLVRCYGDPAYLTVIDASQPCIPSNDKYGDLQKSFLSGHTSTAFAGFGFLSLYIAGKLGICNSRGRGSSWRLLITIFPTFVAMWVGITRYADFHHHVEDVLAGLILGSMIAYITYRCYYPSLSSEHSAYPNSWITPEKDAITALDKNVTPLDRELLLNNVEEEGTEHEGNEKVRAISYITGNVNMSVKISRHVKPSGIESLNVNDNNPWASIQFHWDSKEASFSPEDLQAIREQLPNAMSNLQRTFEEKENGNTVKRL